jgi:hypothetical protein
MRTTSITIGSLVHHSSGILGLVTESFPWDDRWAGFTVRLLRPWLDIGPDFREIKCRADDIVLVSLAPKHNFS